MKIGACIGMAVVFCSFSVNCFAQKQAQAGPPPKIERMPEALENRFALSAAPSPLRENATVYLPGPGQRLWTQPARNQWHQLYRCAKRLAVGESAVPG
jgi:hypothetical protein